MKVGERERRVRTTWKSWILRQKLVVADEIPGCFVITWRKVAQYTSKT